ncbi:hypothetical protein E2C01_031522 [Portunus trituberculatus]|uniref:Uncharacterized protein n=1 Tax=Portunus trituberculatus TaxID=210409 RepID=A0A5B7EUS0_PORTR|nr:hypothetical protein [Portunus trituberculatus]
MSGGGRGRARRHPTPPSSGGQHQHGGRTVDAVQLLPQVLYLFGQNLSDFPVETLLETAARPRGGVADVGGAAGAARSCLVQCVCPRQGRGMTDLFRGGGGVSAAERSPHRQPAAAAA